MIVTDTSNNILHGTVRKEKNLDHIIASFDVLSRTHIHETDFPYLTVFCVAYQKTIIKTRLILLASVMTHC